MATSDTLNFTEKAIIDESIDKFDYHDYQSKITNLDNSGTEIRITINQEGLFILPSEAYILIEGRLLKADGASYANGDAVTLVNNGLMYLFTRAEYQLSGQTEENINNLGRATTMLGLLKYPNYFQNVQGLNQLWFKDLSTTAAIATILGFSTRQSYLIQQPNTKGKFSFVAAGTAAGQVNLTKVSLFMPHVKPSLEYELKLNKEIKSKVTLPVSYIERSSELIIVPQTTNFTWTLNVTSSSTRPRFIIVGFQTNKNNSQEQNPAMFDHCDLKNMYVMLNSRRYPEIGNYNLPFSDQKFSRAYRDAALFTKKFYGMKDFKSQCSINLQDYKTLYPLLFLM
ncbi:uncharacterized protein LOC124815517 [Hydra vulgaris]|uniref:uncharacterized protein LOC124815517 n=1 Tax=Hydra vulgaris TaxID=6087 RepID=UPI0032EA3751